MEIIKNMPKVELHVHLDGSLDIDTIKNNYGLLDGDINDKLICDNNCHDLNDYLKKFDYPLSILQTKEELRLFTISFLENLKKENVVYVEFRFAPLLHTKGGLTQDEVVKTVLDAKNEVDIKSNVILCMMRGFSDKENFETISVSSKYLNKGVCAIDLAGAEAIYKTSNYEHLFSFASSKNIPFTIHAGEADGSDSIKSAIGFGAKRIGHGVMAILDNSILSMIKDNNITLEVCVKSNIDTKVCDSYSAHPLEALYRLGVKTTINTDNGTVSNISLSSEYENILDNTDLSIEDIKQMNINSINASFLSLEEKKELLRFFD